MKGFDKTKAAGDLGQQVQDNLVRLGIDTPVNSTLLQKTNKEKIASIEGHMAEVLNILGMDMSVESVNGTPNRMARMLVLEHNWGLHPENFPVCTTTNAGYMQNAGMIVEKGIDVMSVSEQHMMVFDGNATIAYIPNERVIGISKLSRIVEYFSRRPQTQERLTQQVAETVKLILDTDDVAVVINAVHDCVKSRGVSDQTASTSTSFFSGEFRMNVETRAEFFALAR